MLGLGKQQAGGGPKLGPAAIGALSHPFFGWEGQPPTKLDRTKVGANLL